VKSTNILIIGGGVIGLSTAYHLAKKRVGRITLLEKGKLGEGSSSRAAGIGTQLMWSETGILARRRSFQLFQQYSDEWNNYTFHNKLGCLNLFAPEDWKERELLLPLYERLAIPYEVLDACEMRNRWPDLAPREDLIGLYDPNGGYSEPDEYIAALSGQVRGLGVEVVENESVLDFLRTGDQVTGVQTTSGAIHAEAIVSTVHAWSLPLWKKLGFQQPIKHFVHQRYVTAPLDKPLNTPPVNANPYFGYVRPAAGNRLLMGIETALREEYRVQDIAFDMNDIHVKRSVRDDGQRTCASLVPQLNNVTWESEKVGLISFSVDGEPVFGPAPNTPGLYLATAFHSGGFSYNPVVGELMSEWLVYDKPSLDLKHFLPERFSPPETEAHLDQTLRQNQAVRRRH